ncbi:MAG: hypothetical protein JW751_17685 [Polyangiaceae bacterium]|nr:hypothetical protein [Polyangiaceae bacterium]
MHRRRATLLGFAWWRDAVAVAVALALHGVAIAIVVALPRLPLAPAVSAARLESAIEVDLEPVDRVPAAAAFRGVSGGAERSAAPAGARLSSVVASLTPNPGDRSGLDAAGVELGIDGSGGDREPGGAGDGSGEGAGAAPHASLSLEALGVGPGGRAVLGLHRPGAPTRPSAEQRLARSLAQPAAEHDVELGLGPHGPIIAALEQAANLVLTPTNATALFVARVDHEGRVVRLELLETSRDFGAWSRVAAHARTALDGRRLALSDGARGLALKIHLEAREQLPSGADPGLGVTVAGIPLKKGKGKRSAQIDLLKPQLKVDMVDVPDPGGGAPVRLPAPRIGLDLLNLGIDPADIGSHPQRVVRAHVVSIEVL